VTDGVRALIEVSAALALGDREQLNGALSAALGSAEVTAIEEALLQSYLFLGYPAALRGIAAWRELSGRPAPEALPADVFAWRQRGEETCSRVYGGQYDRLRANIAALHPEMEQWMITEGYGKVLSRPGLDLATRELCIVALLAPQDAAPQLYSHLRGALNAGASETMVAEVVRQLEARLPAERASVLDTQWQAVRARRQDEKN
jgi:4-carboxymuconolactone decarboxylase